MPKIFISYGRDESYGQNLATETQQQLQAAGFEVFRDVIGLKPGDVWYSKLEFELENSDLVVLVISERVRKSKWVHNEISMAEEIGLPIIPLIAEKVRMPLWLRHLQSLDFSEQKDWQRLFDAASGHIGILSTSTEVRSVAKADKPKSMVQAVYESQQSIAVSLLDYMSSNPSWASDSGEDQYGQYADLKVKNSTQRFRLIHPGTFMMGSPEYEKERESRGKETLHQVTLSREFWLADTACTQAFWSAVMGNSPSHFKDNKNTPVEQVSWDDIQEFHWRLSQLKSGLSPDLPTEAQWEYACRAGSVTPFSFGETISPEQVNYDGNNPYANGQHGLYRKKTVPVKSLTANPWGLYEMHGNVWEWCQDTYQEDLGGQACTDPISQAEEGDLYRVLRGGSWSNFGRYCRSAIRNRSRPDSRFQYFGSRLSLAKTERSSGI